MKSLTVGVNRVDMCRLPSWSLEDFCNQWLETLSDMVHN